MLKIDESKFSQVIPFSEYKDSLDFSLEERLKSNLRLDEYLKEKNITCEEYQKSKPVFIANRLVYDSNLIEGIKPPKQGTVLEKDSRKYFEFVDHVRAFEYVINNYQKNLTVSEIKNIHKILMQNVSVFDSKAEDREKLAGEFRKSKAYIHIVTQDPEDKFMQNHLYLGKMHHRSIAGGMRKLEDKIISLNKNSETISKDIWNTHYEFEIIHPFYDGNGRTGRLILNWLTLKHLGVFVNVQNENKFAYYKAINSREPQYRRENPNKFYKDHKEKRINRNYLMFFEDVKNTIKSKLDILNQK